MEDLLKYMVKNLRADPDALEEIAKRSGVPYHTLLKIAKGYTDNPKLRTVEKLLKYFRQREAA
jgi:predicted transcriptional regulator